MSESQIIINKENCLMCGQTLNDSNISLSSVTKYSQKPLLEYFEEITFCSFQSNDDDVGNFCASCYEKFNELDEHLCEAELIKLTLSRLFESSNSSGNVIESAETYTEVFQDDSNFSKVEKLDECIFSEEIIEERIDNPSQSYLHDPSRPFECKICLRRFKENSKLRSHVLIHTNERNIQCQECGKFFKTKACLRAHKRTHYSDRFFCDHCGKEFKRKSELLRHVKSEFLDERDYKCEYCEMDFATQYKLKVHLQTHIGKERRDKICAICTMAFVSNGKLNRHMKSHSKQKDHACQICGKKFLYSYNVRAHIRYVHEGQKRNFGCRICDFKCKSGNVLKTHYRDVHSVIEMIEEFE